MVHAYNEIYLFDAMQNLGEMFEYAHDACHVAPDLTLNYFILSGYADWFEAGNIYTVCGRSGTELFQDICKKCGLDFNNGAEAPCYGITNQREAFRYSTLNSQLLTLNNYLRSDKTSSSYAFTSAYQASRRGAPQVSQNLSHTAVMG